MIVANTFGSFSLLLVFVMGGFIVSRGYFDILIIFKGYRITSSES